MTTTANANFPTGVLLAPANHSGLLGGVQAGANWQFSQWVIGVEGEFSWADINGTTTQASMLIPTTTVFTSAKVTEISTVAARLGYAWNNWLFYGKGGVGWVKHESSSSQVSGAGVATCCTAGGETRSGWLAGAGLEWGLATNWSAKLEYEYINTGTTAITRVNTVTGMVNGRNNEAWLHMVKVGLNYRRPLTSRIMER